MSQFHLPLQATVCGLVCVIAGCCANCGTVLCDGCADISPGSVPPQVGTHVYQWQSAHESLAEADDFVIYQNEWRGESTDLGPFGQRHVSALIPRMTTTSESRPINIEPSGNSELDSDRRSELINMLTGAGVGDAQLWVTVGNGVAEGLYGPEAERLQQSYLGGRSRGGGSGGGSFGGGGGGFGGGGGGLGGGGVF